MITQRRFTRGMTVFPIDLSPDRQNSYHLRPTDKGNLDIIFSLGTAPSEGLTGIYMLVYDAAIVLHKGEVLIAEAI